MKRSSPLIIALALLFSALLASTPLHAAEPLPFLKRDNVIVFQGDSITDGGRQREGNDYNHTMGQGYAFILSAELGALYPERNLTFINRGNSGNRVTDLAGRWQNDTIALKPDLLSILVGINDTLSGGQTAEQYEKAYDKLIKDTQAALPKVKIVLGEPFLLPVGKYKDNYASQLAEVKKRQEAAARLAAKYRLPLVRYQKAFDDACRKAPADHWSWDGVHPHYAGHALMAQEWLKTVNAFWPQG